MHRIATTLHDEINKRLTLNLLIQGSAQHAFLTSHYLVRDELNAIDPTLLPLYDRVALAGFVQYWRSEFVLLFGWPNNFWRRSKNPKHPFSRHPLLSRHGLALALAAKKRADERCRLKGVTRIPVLFSLQMTYLLFKAMYKERKHRQALIDLAKHATHLVWGVPLERLEGDLTNAVAFGTLTPPNSFMSAVLRAGAAGYGGVLGDSPALRVVGKALVWPLLSHELVKATVELICLHGLVDLDEVTYRQVVEAADRIEFEPWMLQAGAELWRELLPLLPIGRPVAEMVMHMARLPARSLECLMLAVVENKDWARELLASLGQDQGTHAPQDRRADDEHPDRVQGCP